MRDKVFYTICFGFLFGVLLRSFLFIDLYLIILFGAISFALFLFFTLISKNNETCLRRRELLLLFLF